MRARRITFFCFHTQPCPDATTQNSKQQQGRFRYTPPVLLGFPLIDAISEERDNVENCNRCVDYHFHSGYKGSENMVTGLTFEEVEKL